MLASPDERQICQLLFQNQTDEAIRLIQQTGFKQSLNSSMISNITTTTQTAKASQQITMAAYGKAIQPMVVPQNLNISTVSSSTV